MCELAFNVQNLIKTKVRNRSDNKNMEALLQIALEGPNKGVDDIINDIVPLWKNDSLYCFCMLIPLVWILLIHQV
jgi:hypothetical protein